MDAGGRGRNALDVLHGRDSEGREGETKTKNREMERKDTGREQKVKQGGWGWGSQEGAGEREERSREEQGGAASSQPLAGPCGRGKPGPEKRKSLNHTELLTAPKSFCAGAASLEELKLLDA